MNYKLYSIKDILSGNFTDILIFTNEEMAIRYFNGLCAESKIKDDLQLFCLGDYNSQTGVIESNVHFIKGGVDYEQK